MTESEIFVHFLKCIKMAHFVNNGFYQLGLICKVRFGVGMDILGKFIHFGFIEFLMTPSVCRKHVLMWKEQFSTSILNSKRGHCNLVQWFTIGTRRKVSV